MQITLLTYWSFKKSNHLETVSKISNFLAVPTYDPEHEKIQLSMVHAVEALGGRKCSFHSLLTSTLDGYEWSLSHLGRGLPPRKSTPGTQWIRDWVVRRTGVDAEAIRRTFAPAKD
jgi:hypothetical protein